MSEPDITKKKKRKRSVRVYVNVHKPVNPEAAALIGDFPDDDDDQPTPAHTEARARTRSTAKGYFGEPLPGDTYASRRVSEPLTAGHQAPATGDHGVGQGRNPGLAAHHGDLRQSSPAAFDAVTRLMSVLGDNQHGDRSVTQTVGEVGLRMFNARGQAGTYGGMQPVNPNPLRPDYGMARNSATPPNGGHGLADPQSHAGAMKASDRVAVMRQAMFGDRAR